MGTHVFPGKHANLGVSALCESLLKLCLRQQPDTEFWLMDCHSSRERTVEMRPLGEDFKVNLISWRLSLRSNLRENLAVITAASLLYKLVPIHAFRSFIASRIPWIGAVAKVSFVGDIHGGDSFSDIYGFGRFARAWIAAWTVLLVNGNLVQFPQTYGPFKSKRAQWMAAWLLRRSSLLIARDKRSQEIAQSLVGNRTKVWLSPDVAFELAVEPPERVEIAPEPAVPGTIAPRTVGINLNGLMFNGGYTRDNMFSLKLDYRDFIQRLIVELLGKHDGEILLVPHTITPHGISESDNEANEWLWNWLPDDLKPRVRRVEGVYSCHEIKWIIGQCDFFIGSRMHACIAALSQGIPCVGVAYSMKFKGVFESVGMEDWVIDGRDLDAGEVLAATLERFGRRNEVRDGLKARVGQAKQSLATVFARILSRGDAGKVAAAGRTTTGEAAVEELPVTPPLA